MLNPFECALTLDEYISHQNLILTEKKDRIKFLKRTLKDLDLNYCSIPLPLTAFNQTSIEPVETNDEENSSDTKQPAKASTPDYDETYAFLSKLGEFGEEQRRRFAEERRKEYNEYLKEAKFATSRIKMLERKSEAIRMQSPIRSYAELLDEKRASEKAYRHTNDHHISSEPASLEPDFYGYNAKYHRDSGFDILNWQSKYPGSDVEPLVPKNRLLATQSSRVRASQYKEELRKQIEEKHRLEEEKRKKEKEEERLIEKRLQEQRLRILREYEEEQYRQRVKADSLARKQEIIKEMIAGSDDKCRSNSKEKKDHDGPSNSSKELAKFSSTPTSSLVNRLPRSPSYLHIRPSKSPNTRKPRISLESRFGMIEGDTTSKKMVRSPLSSRSKQSIQSPLRNEGGDMFSPPPSEPAKYNPPNESEIKRTTPIIKQHQSNHKVTINKQNSSHEVNSPNSQATSSDHHPGDRVLTRLSEVRRKMQEDHQRMLQQLENQI